MGRPRVDQHRQRFLPRSTGLACQPGNQVQVQVGNAGRAQPAQVVHDHCPRVQPPAHPRLAVDERLHTQAHAVNALRRQRFQRAIPQLARRALHRNLGVRLPHKLRPQRCKQTRNQSRRQQAGRSAAQVDCIHPPRQTHPHSRSPRPCRCHVLDDPVHIALVVARRIDSRRKVAIGALGAAKRNRDVEAEPVVLRTCHKSDSFTCSGSALSASTRPGSCQN